MVAGLKPYPAMKDSGVVWLGEVPAHWEVKRLRNTVDMRVSNVDKRSKTGERPVRLCNYVDVYNNDLISQRLGFMEATASPVEAERFRLMTGDVLITKDSESWTDIAIPALVAESAPDLVSGYHLALLRPRVEEVAGGYLLRVLQSNNLTYQFHIEARGVTRFGLTHSGIKSVWLPLPSPTEQATIVRFLDHADRRIRRYIRAKEMLIALLGEQKQAIIHQAVTGRIDVRTGQPYPAYKSSGVEWLGEVPAHWGRCRLRNVVSEVATGSRGWSSYASDAGPLFIRVANLSRGSLQLRHDDVVRLNLPETSEASRTRIESGDILMSVTAYIGSVGIAPDGFEEAYVSQHVARCKPRSHASSWWLGYVLLSQVGQIHGQISLYGGTKDGLSLDDVKNYPILLPPLCEQDCIVRWIERELASVASAYDETLRQIELIHEYRTRLIADVVTGKLDVREAAAALPEVDSLADDDDVGDGLGADETPAFDDDQEPAEVVG